MQTRSVPSPTLKLRFSHAIPLRLENELVKRGFSIYSRKRGSWVVYEKRQKVASELSEIVINDLVHKLNRIANAFKDVESNKEIIKVRCTNLARTMQPLERAWCLDWIRRVIDEEDNDNDPPWEDTEREVSYL